MNSDGEGSNGNSVISVADSDATDSIAKRPVPPPRPEVMECSNTNWIVCQLSKPQWVEDQRHWVYYTNPRSGASSWVPPPLDNIESTTDPSLNYVLLYLRCYLSLLNSEFNVVVLF